MVFLATQFNTDHKLSGSLRSFMDEIYESYDSSDEGEDEEQCKDEDRHTVKRPYVMLSGPLYSGESKPMAELAATFTLVQLSSSAISPALSNKKKYPLFFRSVPSTNTYMPVRIGICKLFNWTRIGILAEDHASPRDVSAAACFVVELLAKTMLPFLTVDPGFHFILRSL